MSFMETLRIELNAGERIWGGRVTDGVSMPYRAGFEADLLDPKANQVSYLLVSDQGRVIDSDRPFAFKIEEDAVVIDARAAVHVHRAGDALSDALFYAREHVYPRLEGLRVPDEMFLSPQYNTWIELIYNQNQQDIIRYAEALIEGGYPPGVFMIDNGWEESYGTWRFHPGRFPDPHAMMDRLHELGFKVLLWIVPFVTADTLTCQLLLRAHPDIFLRRKNGDVAIIKWWEGYSALLDLSNPAAGEWLRGELKYLQDEYHVDGFKFDAGAPSFYPDDCVTYVPGCMGDRQTRLFCELAAEYQLSELRECASQPNLRCAMRLCDKIPAWTGNGLDTLIPNTLAQGVLGYYDVCPDMIGGGEYLYFMYGDLKIDEELFVRWAQCSALLPMMQFSAAPWRVLSKENAALCRDAALLHTRFAAYILSCVRRAHETGIPAAAPMEAHYPHAGYADIIDQYMLGRDMLVAPVCVKGASERQVVLPEGTWRADDGAVYEGNQTITVKTPVERLPYFVRVGGEADK